MESLEILSEDRSAALAAIAGSVQTCPVASVVVAVVAAGADAVLAAKSIASSVAATIAPSLESDAICTSGHTSMS